jgi:hypothetical protein
MEHAAFIRQSGAALNHDAQSISLQPMERPLQLGQAISRHLESGDAGKAPSQMAHPALQPITAVIGHTGRHQFHQAGPVIADDSHHEAFNHGFRLGIGTAR